MNYSSAHAAALKEGGGQLPRGKNMNFICFRIPEIELVKGHFVYETGRLSFYTSYPD